MSISDHIPVDRPQPVTNAGRVAGATSGTATAVATILVAVGLITQTDANQLLVAVTTVVGALVTIITAVAPVIQSYKARDLVTPLSDPRDSAGVALRPVLDPATVTLDTDNAGRNPAAPPSA